ASDQRRARVEFLIGIFARAVNAFVNRDWRVGVYQRAIRGRVAREDPALPGRCAPARDARRDADAADLEEAAPRIAVGGLVTAAARIGRLRLRHVRDPAAAGPCGLN